MVSSVLAASKAITSGVGALTAAASRSARMTAGEASCRSPHHLVRTWVALELPSKSAFRRSSADEDWAKAGPKIGASAAKTSNVRGAFIGLSGRPPEQHRRNPTQQHCHED